LGKLEIGKEKVFLHLKRGKKNIETQSRKVLLKEVSFVLVRMEEDH